MRDGQKSAAKPEGLYEQLSLADLRVVIEVHRANCRQPSCPVLAAMEEHVATRKAES